MHIEKELKGDLRKIAEVAGLEAAMKIGSAFRGTSLYINGLDGLKRKVRDEEIRRAYEAGTKVRSLSRRYGLSERQIRRILGEEPEDKLPLAAVSIIKNS